VYAAILRNGYLIKRLHFTAQSVVAMQPAGVKLGWGYVSPAD
jgi:hypothetical protein